MISSVKTISTIYTIFQVKYYKDIVYSLKPYCDILNATLAPQLPMTLFLTNY